MTMFTLEQLLRYRWVPHFEDLGDGRAKLTVSGLSDLEVFGPREELENEWRDALAAHLSGYIAVGKAVPVPVHFVDTQPGEVNRVIFDDQMHLVEQCAA